MSAPRPPLRIGMIGAGMVSRHHLSAWAKVAGATVVAIADPATGRAEERAREFGIARAFGDAESMLAAQALDAVDIATPVGTHAGLCRLAAAQSLDVLCQKPLAPTLAEARALVGDLRGRVRLMVHENWRFRPHYRAIRRWLDEGAIGTPTRVRLEVASSGLLPDAIGQRPALVRQPFLAGLERFLVFEVLIHHLDVLNWLFGPLRASEARLGQLSGAVRGEDTADIVLVGGHGLRIELAASLACPGAPAYVMDRMAATGTQGEIRLDDTTATLSGRNFEVAATDFATMYAASYEGAIGDFVRALATGAAFETEAAENLASLRLVEEIYRVAAPPGDPR